MASDAGRLAALEIDVGLAVVWACDTVEQVAQCVRVADMVLGDDEHGGHVRRHIIEGAKALGGDVAANCIPWSWTGSGRLLDGEWTKTMRGLRLDAWANLPGRWS